MFDASDKSEFTTFTVEMKPLTFEEKSTSNYSTKASAFLQVQFKFTPI